MNLHSMLRWIALSVLIVSLAACAAPVPPSSTTTAPAPAPHAESPTISANEDGALELESDDAAGYYDRGKAYADIGDYDLAIADFDKALQLKPDLAMGLSQPGEVSISLGTSGVVFAPASSYQPESRGRLHTFAYIPGMWHWMGVMLSAGGSLRWFRDTLGGGASYDDLMLEAAGVEAGCEGLLFLPYLTGERTPHADPNARGAFVGLTVRHSRGHLTRAVIEGVSFGLRDSLELMRGLGLGPGQVRVSGGGAKSGLWRQILADVLNVDIVTVNSNEGAAYGAAILAAVGVQAFPDVSTATRQLIRVTSPISPGGDAGLYAEAYPRYRALYPALKFVFNNGTSANQKAGD